MTKSMTVLTIIVAFAVITAFGLTSLLFQTDLAGASESAAAAAGATAGSGQWALIGAALSAGLSALAAGYAVGMVGAAAVGAMAEKPELFGRLLVLVGLAEGIAIYGLIIAILILNRAG